MTEVAPQRTRIGKNYSFIDVWPPKMTSARVYCLWKKTRKQAEQHGKVMNSVLRRVLNEMGGKAYAFIIDASWWVFEVHDQYGVLTYTRNRVKGSEGSEGSNGVGLELFRMEKRLASLWGRVVRIEVALRHILEEKASEAAMPKLSAWEYITTVVITMGEDVFVVSAELVAPSIVNSHLLRWPDETVHCKIDVEGANGNP